jgi:hypothetical protein
MWTISNPAIIGLVRSTVFSTPSFGLSESDFGVVLKLHRYDAFSCYLLERYSGGDKSLGRDHGCQRVHRRRGWQRIVGSEIKFVIVDRHVFTPLEI